MWCPVTSSNMIINFMESGNVFLKKATLNHHGFVVSVGYVLIFTSCTTMLINFNDHVRSKILEKSDMAVSLSYITSFEINVAFKLSLLWVALHSSVRCCFCLQINLYNNTEDELHFRAKCSKINCINGHPWQKRGFIRFSFMLLRFFNAGIKIAVSPLY